MQGETLKHYSFNILIVLLLVITLFLSYSFIKRIYADKPEVKFQPVDSTSFITKQSIGKTLQIDIQNACGVQGIAEKFTEYLRSKGFDVVEMGNFSTQDIKTTMVIDRAGNLANARRVALALGVSPKYVIQQMNKNYFLDATVVIGKDYEELLPFKKEPAAKE
ncbi:MAG: LytR C-terminal domain-containing protein [Ignavibacteria bacterium]|nr:LytR C-terminal domain-containing protein [Ignavibacteria bacterium]